MIREWPISGADFSMSPYHHAWVEALNHAGPQAAAFGDAYLQLLLDDPFGCFDTAAAEAAMGAAVLARFRKILATRRREAKDAAHAARAQQVALAAQAALKGKRAPYYARYSERDMRLWTLEQMYLGQLEAEGDIDGALAVTREDMMETGGYHQVTEFLERHGRLREAFANAKQGRKTFPNDSRLQEDLLRCYERDGWVEEALALRQRRFKDGPSVEQYHEALKAGAAAARDADGMRAELQGELTVREDEAMARSASRPALYGHRHGADAGQRDVSLRAEVLCSEGRWDEALELVRTPNYCRDGVLAYLASRLGPEHLAQRIELLIQVFAGEMRNSKSPYRRELKLVEEIAGLLDTTRRASWLVQLRLEYKAKKNFVRHLPER
jgi:hypothetical protein